MEACELLTELNCQFEVAGFGSSPWPVDITYDLSTLLEQIPLLAQSLGEDQNAEVDFYGQGLERTLSFSRIDSYVEIRCISRTEWLPTPEVERIDFDDLMRMLGHLVFNFTMGLEFIGVDVASTPPFDKWRHAEI
jgi:hypothetical protein